MHRAVARKKILAQEMGQKKILAGEKSPTPPPITFLMVRPLHNATNCKSLSEITFHAGNTKMPQTEQENELYLFVGHRLRIKKSGFFSRST